MTIETKSLTADLTGAVWHKSTRSGPNCDNCVEVAFVKSSRSSESFNCVEVGRCDCGCEPVIAVRDSKNPAGPVLLFTDAEWAAFVAGTKDGEFDL